ncbi:hypothetical protein C2U71_13620 [Burkholderia ubonensis]|nr:hypothetical protein C2U71_13620 [Burkholderia ubonensis]
MSHYLLVRLAPVLRKFPESRLQLACEAGESGKIARCFRALRSLFSAPGSTPKTRANPKTKPNRSNLVTFHQTIFDDHFSACYGSPH